MEKRSAVGRNLDFREEDGSVGSNQGIGTPLFFQFLLQRLSIFLSKRETMHSRSLSSFTLYTFVIIRFKDAHSVSPPGLFHKHRSSTSMIHYRTFFWIYSAGEGGIYLWILLGTSKGGKKSKKKHGLPLLHLPRPLLLSTTTTTTILLLHHSTNNFRKPTTYHSTNLLTFHRSNLSFESLVCDGGAV